MYQQKNSDSLTKIDKLNLSRVYNELAVLPFQRSKEDDSTYYLKKSLLLFKEVQDMGKIKEVDELLEKIYEN